MSTTGVVTTIISFVFMTFAAVAGSVAQERHRDPRWARVIGPSYALFALGFVLAILSISH